MPFKTVSPLLVWISDLGYQAAFPSPSYRFYIPFSFQNEISKSNLLCLASSLLNIYI